MKRIPVTLILPLLLITSACGVSKEDHESVLAELQACQEEKSQIEAQVITWEQRFDRESQRWEELGASVGDQLPQVMSDFNAERDRIVEMVPEQVKDEVQDYLDDYFATVMTGFEKMSEDNREVQLRLDATHRVLERLGSDTEAISQSIDTTLQDERSKRQVESGKREAVAAKIANVVAMVTEFDGTMLNCKKCPDRLKLNRKGREALSAFHDRLTTELAQIQTFAGDPGLGSGYGTEPVSDESMEDEPVSEEPVDVEPVEGP